MMYVKCVCYSQDEGVAGSSNSQGADLRNGKQGLVLRLLTVCVVK